MNSNTCIIIIVLILIVIFIYFRNTENFVTNTEAINNIASLYNAANLTATNINATGTINTPSTIYAGIVKSSLSRPEGGQISIMNPSKTGAGNTNEWTIFNMTGDYQKGLNFWRYNADGTNAGPSVIFKDSGDVNMTNNLTVNGAINSGPIATGSTINASGNIAGGGLISNGDISAKGRICINGTCLDQAQLQLMIARLYV